MKIIEEHLLLNNIKLIKKFILKQNKINSIFENIEKLKITSLQDLSVVSDLEFFDEISFILSVITSIVSHPRIITKGEDVIIRAELAPSIEGNGLIETLQDSRLWKQKKIEMVPEYVHYHQSTDEIATYENRFICLVINIIEQELIKYNSFYISLIKNFNGENTLSLDIDKQDKALEKISILLKKIKFIKNTYFYKEVIKKLGVFKTVQPTNILLKNRLYNYCFKFYRKNILYVDKTILENDFRSYYIMLLIKALKNNGYKVDKDFDNEIDYDEEEGVKFKVLKFKNDTFTVVLNNHPLGLSVDISNNFIKGNKITKQSHLLLFDIENGFNNIHNNFSKYFPVNNYTTVECLSIWKMGILENINNDKLTFDLKISEDNIVKEDELINKWLLSKTQTSEASLNLYLKYCPVCKGMEKEIDNNIYKCNNCNSVYTFYKDKNNKQKVWFIRLRRY